MNFKWLRSIFTNFLHLVFVVSLVFLFRSTPYRPIRTPTIKSSFSGPWWLPDSFSPNVHTAIRFYTQYGFNMIPLEVVWWVYLVSHRWEVTSVQTILNEINLTREEVESTLSSIKDPIQFISTTGQIEYCASTGQGSINTPVGPPFVPHIDRRNGEKYYKIEGSLLKDKLLDDQSRKKRSQSHYGAEHSFKHHVVRYYQLSKPQINGSGVDTPSLDYTYTTLHVVLDRRNLLPNGDLALRIIPKLSFSDGDSFKLFSNLMELIHITYNLKSNLVLTQSIPGPEYIMLRNIILVKLAICLIHHFLGPKEESSSIWFEIMWILVNLVDRIVNISSLTSVLLGLYNSNISLINSPKWDQDLTPGIAKYSNHFLNLVYNSLFTFSIPWFPGSSTLHKGLTGSLNVNNPVILVIALVIKGCICLAVIMTLYLYDMQTRGTDLFLGLDFEQTDSWSWWILGGVLVFGLNAVFSILKQKVIGICLAALVN